MSMISDLVDRLRTESKSMGKYGTDYMATLLMQASTTIITLSEKARADRPQGKWLIEKTLYDNYNYRCSYCDWYECHAYSDVEPYNYCPDCGARMKGADDDEV